MRGITWGISLELQVKTPADPALVIGDIFESYRPGGGRSNGRRLVEYVLQCQKLLLELVIGREESVVPGTGEQGYCSRLVADKEIAEHSRKPEL